MKITKSHIKYLIEKRDKDKDDTFRKLAGAAALAGGTYMGAKGLEKAGIIGPKATDPNWGKGTREKAAKDIYYNYKTAPDLYSNYGQQQGEIPVYGIGGKDIIAYTGYQTSLPRPEQGGQTRGRPLKSIDYVQDKSGHLGPQAYYDYDIGGWIVDDPEGYDHLKQADWQGSYLFDENVSLSEGVEPTGGMAKIAAIVKNKQHGKVGGQTVDMQSANLLMKLYNAVKDKDKEKMNKMSEKKLIMVLNKLWSRVKLKLPV